MEACIERELAATPDDLETLLKNPEVLAAFTDEGLNASLVLVAAHGIRGYLPGNKLEATEDFETAAEAIRVRVAGPVQDATS